MRDQYLAAGIGSSEDYTQIFSGFPLEPYLATENAPSIRMKLGLLKDDFVVGKIARLFELKGHEDLFAVAPRLAKRVPNIRFLLVGDGLWRESFERLAKRIGCEENSVFTGLVPPSTSVTRASWTASHPPAGRSAPRPTAGDDSGAGGGFRLRWSRSLPRWRNRGAYPPG